MPLWQERYKGLVKGKKAKRNKEEKEKVWKARKERMEINEKKGRNIRAGREELFIFIFEISPECI